MAEAHLVALAVVALVFGVPLAIWPYRAARFEERLDAIGRKPAGRVEPSDWYVLFTRVVGIALVAAGVVSAVLFVL